MKRLLGLILILAILAGSSFAGIRKGSYVRGYYKKNGTYVSGHFRSGSWTYSMPALPCIPECGVPKTTHDHWSVWTSTPSQTYDINGTKYIYGETYKNGRPKVQRNSDAKENFLRSHDLDKIPDGYEIDHVVPLHWGGTDDPSNMQLLTKAEHARKTALERQIDSERQRNSLNGMRVR
jgi:hypothetical protein